MHKAVNKQERRWQCGKGQPYVPIRNCKPDERQQYIWKQHKSRVDPNRKLRRRHNGEGTATVVPRHSAARGQIRSPALPNESLCAKPIGAADGTYAKKSHDKHLTTGCIGDRQRAAGRAGRTVGLTRCPTGRRRHLYGQLRDLPRGKWRRPWRAAGGDGSGACQPEAAAVVGSTLRRQSFSCHSQRRAWHRYAGMADAQRSADLERRRLHRFA